ncbi:RNase H domain protein [Metarhizium robertsii]|uniref:ribonuclease H n=1 Tax=Metarhizium robertsii TaxID=568076 RepID=A0A014PIH9_9HYPO|nr:RNase H domain protein [Metarhizium robertsii]
MTLIVMTALDPLSLPNGRLVCRRHGLAVCPYCCVDFSFMEELSEDPDERLGCETSEICEHLSDEMQADIDARWAPPPSTRANSPAYHRNTGTHTGFHIVHIAASSELCGGPAIRRGTGRLFATKFSPPSATSAPGALFPAGIGHQAIPRVARFIRRWAFVFKPETNQPTGIVSGRLEKRGPFGDESSQTSNRAELRAVLAALRFRHWQGEGFTTLVFAADSEYVAEGATTWIRSWVCNGWKTSNGAEVKNKDMCEMLLGEIERWDDSGLKIQFWRIPRTLNVMADDAAKQAARKVEDPDEYCEINGVLT